MIQTPESLLDRLLAADLKTYLHELLMKQDQMSMAASVESRVPFLDHKLVEFATQLPVTDEVARMDHKIRIATSHAQRAAERDSETQEDGLRGAAGSWLRGPFRHILDDYVLGAESRSAASSTQRMSRNLLPDI